VIISGRLDTLSDVRQAIVRAEERIYDRYNELNDRRDYDITCFEYAPTGKRLKTRVCEAGYVRDAKREEAMPLFRGSQNGNLRLASNSGIVQSKLSEMQRRMRRIAESDAEMQRTLVEHALLKERYQLLHEKKFPRNRELNRASPRAVRQP
jgi:hypothetical protein